MFIGDYCMIYDHSYNDILKEIENGQSFILKENESYKYIARMWDGKLLIMSFLLENHVWTSVPFDNLLLSKDQIKKINDFFNNFN